MQYQECRSKPNTCLRDKRGSIIGHDSGQIMLSSTLETDESLLRVWMQTICLRYQEVGSLVVKCDCVRII